MTTTTAPFWLATLALAALAWSALWTAARRGTASDAGPGRSNIRLLDEQLEALQADHQRGAIDAAQWQRGQAEIERRLLDEAIDAGPREHRAAGGGAGTGRLTIAALTLAALALLLPAIAGGGYLLLGNPAALSPAATATATEPTVSSADVQAMVDTLASRMRARPPGQADDLPGWTMLARSLAALQRFDEAASAFERAIALAPNDASLLVDLADVLATRRGPGGVAAAGDRSAGLVARALVLDPGNVKALALAGNAAFERHDTAAATAFWRRARALVPAGSEFATGLDQNLAEAGVTPAGADRPPPGASHAASVHGTVRIADALIARVAPGDTVFIYARDADGPPMPLAVLRRTAGDLPIEFTLDDSLAMSPQRRLSQAERLVVGARVSHSGDALPHPGDVIGQVEAVAGGPALSITLDRVQP